MVSVSSDAIRLHFAAALGAGLMLLIWTVVPVLADTRPALSIDLETEILPESVKPREHARASEDKLRIRYPRSDMLDSETTKLTDTHHFCAGSGPDPCNRGGITPTIDWLERQISLSSNLSGRAPTGEELRLGGYTLSTDGAVATSTFEVAMRAQAEFTIYLNPKSIAELEVVCTPPADVVLSLVTKPKFDSSLATLETDGKIQALRRDLLERAKREAASVCNQIASDSITISESQRGLLLTRTGFRHPVGFTFFGDRYDLELKIGFDTTKLPPG